MTVSTGMNKNVFQLAPYTAVDFKTLARKDEDFRKLWKKHSGNLDFRDEEVTQVLSRAILRADFGLDVHLSSDRLCPPIPNRWNYIAWVQSLLDSTSPNYTGGYEPNRHVVGLDIGTGASAIYTMLALQSRPNWNMCATDIDRESFASATKNLTTNGLATRTRLLLTETADPLVPLQQLGVDKLDFTICNPPFFKSEAEMQASLKGEGKKHKPSAICTGSEVEMVCPGGDLGFVTRIVLESLELRQKITWYSSMLGKLKSAKAIIRLLKEHGIMNWAVGCIETGSMTRRWIVAWSFGDYRPRNSIARAERFEKEYLPFPTEYRFTVVEPQNAETIVMQLNALLSDLDLRWSWNDEKKIGTGEASQNVWQRAYRRSHARRIQGAAMKADSDEEMDEDIEKPAVALAFRVKIEESASTIILEWLRGRDQVLWESFCGMVHRSLHKTG